MRIRESDLRSLTRKIIKELFTKKNPLTLSKAFSAEYTPDDSGDAGYGDYGDGGGYFESDDPQLEEDEEGLE